MLIYKIKLPGDYGLVSATFDVVDLSPYIKSIQLSQTRRRVFFNLGIMKVEWTIYAVLIK